MTVNEGQELDVGATASPRKESTTSTGTVAMPRPSLLAPGMQDILDDPMDVSAALARMTSPFKRMSTCLQATTSVDQNDAARRRSTMKHPKLVSIQDETPIEQMSHGRVLNTLKRRKTMRASSKPELVDTGESVFPQAVEVDSEEQAGAIVRGPRKSLLSLFNDEEGVLVAFNEEEHGAMLAGGQLSAMMASASTPRPGSSTASKSSSRSNSTSEDNEEDLPEQRTNEVSKTGEGLEVQDSAADDEPLTPSKLTDLALSQLSLGSSSSGGSYQGEQTTAEIPAEAPTVKPLKQSGSVTTVDTEVPVTPSELQELPTTRPGIPKLERGSTTVLLEQGAEEL